MRRFSLLPLLVWLVAGCSGGPYKTAPVSGRVTLNGQPLVNASVLFQPVPTEGNINPGLGSTGVTNSDGRYSLKMIGKSTNGAVIGKHKVRISLRHESDSADDRQKRYKQLPAQYNKDTKLEYEVPAGGTGSANFELTSK